MNRQFALFISLITFSFGLLGCQNETSHQDTLLTETTITAEDVAAAVPPNPPSCDIELAVLGHGQDAGRPQIGRHGDAAWTDQNQSVLATSLGLINHKTGERYLFDATPDIAEQSYRLAQLTSDPSFHLDGIFLTHAHMGHYLGLAFLGREAMGAKNIPVYAMPKMGRFLRENGPWNLLISLGNISIKPILHERPVHLKHGVSITPFKVPHRGEFTETVGYRIQTLDKRAVYLPDIDSWNEWDSWNKTKQTDINIGINPEVAAADILFLDATFYSGAELPGRDISKIPHPTIATSMKRFKKLPFEEREKIHFIHLNHSNPALDPTSEQSQIIDQFGFNLAKTGDRHCLYKAP